MGRIIISPREYSEWHKKTGVKVKSYPVVNAIRDIKARGEKVSNQAVAKEVGVTAVRAGQVTKTLEANGIIMDSSKHPLRRDWQFTDLGNDLSIFLLERTVAK